MNNLRDDPLEYLFTKDTLEANSWVGTSVPDTPAAALIPATVDPDLTLGVTGHFDLNFLPNLDFGSWDPTEEAQELGIGSGP